MRDQIIQKEVQFMATARRAVRVCGRGIVSVLVKETLGFRDYSQISTDY